MFLNKQILQHIYFYIIMHAHYSFQILHRQVIFNLNVLTRNHLLDFSLALLALILKPSVVTNSKRLLFGDETLV